MSISSAMAHERATKLRCPRCGRRFFSEGCVHTLAVDDMSDAEAERVQARYELGKRSNPDHDNTSYRDAAYADVEA